MLFMAKSSINAIQWWVFIFPKKIPEWNGSELFGASFGTRKMALDLIRNPMDCSWDLVFKAPSPGQKSRGAVLGRFTLPPGVLHELLGLMGADPEMEDAPTMNGVEV